MSGTIGLDIGGANIKAAHSGGGCVSEPFAVWQHPGDLPDMLMAVMEKLPACERIAVTMTAELCDCFETKADGVKAVLQAAMAVSDGREVLVWLTDGRFADVKTAGAEPLKASASNWHAQATLLGQQMPDRNLVLIDMGSTTTDIIPIEQGKVVASGLTDMARLGTRELVYVGAKRTTLCALGPNVWFDNHSWSVMAEHFATMDDALIVLDMAQPSDETDTADGRPRTKPYAMARLARMIGADMTMIDEAQARSLAESFVDLAIQMIANGVIRSLVPLDGKVDSFVISGSGSDLAELAARRARPDVSTTRLTETIGDEAAAASCAYAVATLASQHAGESAK